MAAFDVSLLPLDTRQWLEAKAAACGFNSVADLIREYLCKLHEFDIEQEARLEATLLDRLEEPATEMTSEDWAELRADLRRRHPDPR